MKRWWMVFGMGRYEEIGHFVGNVFAENKDDAAEIAETAFGYKTEVELDRKLEDTTSEFLGTARNDAQ